MFILTLLSMMTAASAEPARLRVATWNLWHGFGPGGVIGFAPAESRENAAGRARDHRAALDATHADVDLLQECNPLGRARPLARAMAKTQSGQLDAVGVKLFGLGLPQGLDSGLATLSRRELNSRSRGAISLLHPRYTLVHRLASAQVKEERFALFTALDFAGRKILMVNTQLHDGLEAPLEFRDAVLSRASARGLDAAGLRRLDQRLTSGDRRRRREIEFILSRVDELARAHDVVVIAGDFNADPTSDAARAMSAAGYRDAWATARPTEPGFTYDRRTNPLNARVQDQANPALRLDDLGLAEPARIELDQVVRAFEQRPRRIDYVWFKSTRDAVVVEDVGLIGTAKDGRPASDHFGVWVELQLSPRAN